MTVKSVPAFSMPTNDPASEGNARKRNPPDPTASTTLSINRCGWEAGAWDEVEEVGVEDAGVDGVEVDDDVEGVEGVDAGAGVEVDAEP